ncbi:MAG: collagen-like protein, partial [Streptomyces sp.]|nr:collagen-like protein [Streptomyces sp.]
MSKRNTRVRAIRIVAAVVVAGGASLTAVGAAQAVTPDHTNPIVKALDGEGDSGNTTLGTGDQG